MSFTVKTTWRGSEVALDERGGAARGLFLAAENVLEQATRIVPLNEGTLMRSGVASVDAEQLVAAIAYDTPYAVRQHEELDYSHQRGRQAKYLETPFNASIETSRMLIAREIAKAIGA